MGTRGAFIHECREHGMTPGNSNGKRRSSVSNASGVFEKLKTNVFEAFDEVDMDTFLEVSTFIRNRSRIFVTVGHKTTYLLPMLLVEKIAFSLNRVIVRLAKIINKLLKVLKILIFSHFSTSKIG